MAGWRRVVGVAVLVQAVAVALFGLHSTGVVQRHTRNAASSIIAQGPLPLGEAEARRLKRKPAGSKGKGKGKPPKRGDKGKSAVKGKAKQAMKAKKEAMDRVKDSKAGKKDAMGKLKANLRGGMDKQKDMLKSMKQAMEGKKGQKPPPKPKHGKKGVKKSSKKGHEKKGPPKKAGSKHAMDMLKKCSMEKVKQAMAEAEVLKESLKDEAEWKSLVMRLAEANADDKCSAEETMMAMRVAWGMAQEKKKGDMGEKGKEAMALLKQCTMARVNEAMARAEASKDKMLGAEEKKQVLMMLAGDAADDKCNAEETMKAMMVAWEISKKTTGAEGKRRGGK